MYDIIIIGAGPAGLTAAIYGTRANKKVLVLEAKSYGGQIINASKIDNYPGISHISGIDFATNLYNQVKELGAEIIFEKAINIDYSNNNKKVITNRNEYFGKSIIIATGADKRKLGLNNEDELIGKGISYCATCDGIFFKDKDVAIVGGGDAALSDAEYLSNICSKVYLIHRREDFRGNERTVIDLKNKKNVVFILNSTITQINGFTLLESIDVKDKAGVLKNIPVSALFIAIGQVPETSNIVEKLEKNDLGYIIANEDTKTNIEGVFVAGDVRQKNLRQLTTAVSDGSQAAVMACNYIKSKLDM